MEETPTENGDKRNPDGTFAVGSKGGPGRPKGSVSVMAKIKQYLEEHPDRLDDLVHYYLTEETHRALLLQMIDGRPPQDVTTGGERLPVPILYVPNDISDQKDNGVEQTN